MLLDSKLIIGLVMLMMIVTSPPETDNEDDDGGGGVDNGDDDNDDTHGHDHQGLDDLDARCKEYKRLGCQFAKVSSCL